jgi:hypothetical protein
MALTNKDIERMGEVFAARLVAELEPVNRLLQKHEQMLLGVNGDNGLNGDIKCFKEFKAKHEITEARRAGFVAAISSVVTLIGLAGREIIKAVIGK